MYNLDFGDDGTIGTPLIQTYTYTRHATVHPNINFRAARRDTTPHTQTSMQTCRHTSHTAMTARRKRVCVRERRGVAHKM